MNNFDKRTFKDDVPCPKSKLWVFQCLRTTLLIYLFKFIKTLTLLLAFSCFTGILLTGTVIVHKVTPQGKSIALVLATLEIH